MKSELYISNSQNSDFDHSQKSNLNDLEKSTPVLETTKPILETTTPILETTTPAKETTSPISDTTTPFIETTTPFSETTTPILEITTQTVDASTIQSFIAGNGTDIVIINYACVVFVVEGDYSFKVPDNQDSSELCVKQCLAKDARYLFFATSYYKE